MRKLSPLAGLLALTLPVAAGATEYTIDPAHTTIEFSVKHMMVATVRGKFSGVTGTVKYNPDNPGETRIDAAIDLSTVDTGQPKRDAHLKSPDFFDVARYQTMTYSSVGATRGADGLLHVQGNLTLHGVTRPVELAIDGPTDAVKDPMGHWKVGATARGKLSRKEFGLVWNKALEGGGVLVGDEIDITLDIELTRL